MTFGEQKKAGEICGLKIRFWEFRLMLKERNLFSFSVPFLLLLTFLLLFNMKSIVISHFIHKSEIIDFMSTTKIAASSGKFSRTENSKS